ncbi:hypothetical protein BHF71_08175 [Vulcanibacillus modesticaldus]|uniref:Uncharacterized protein n=1 Tax=Vulcanibacillus modesticaldus TaxID=337097 RepID=A0A1D2YV57_9BACI|nr:hypothetical protein [Vulcanibacillus modesticaldus]OEF99589.1 hypothetical protein BHF71_08175 [Vulcanibacillus modesticaldus]
MKAIESLLEELKSVLKIHNQKPYLPYWGDLFIILNQVKKIAIKNNEDVYFYQIKPSGKLKYDYKKKQFIVEVPDLNILVKDDELIDSLLNGRFIPK